MKTLLQQQQRCHVPTRATQRRRGTCVRAAAAPETAERMDGRAVRRSLNQTGRYVRQPKDDAESLSLMEQHGVGYSRAGLVAQMRENDFQWQQGDITVKLAQAYGYCWGVERAVQMAYEARKSFPDSRLFITNEIIHNPEVNQRLKEMNVEIVEETGAGKDFSKIGEGDVVIFPAFGATVQEMALFRDRGVQMVDTTCPWVAKVWNSVDNHTKKSFTSVIHGKYYHEETIATASFADKYIVVKTIEEAQYLCDYILNGGNKDEFMAKFKKATSKGFDPEKDLDKLGLANQTTMLKSETEQVGKLLEKTMLQKYGPAELNNHLLLMETICDATDERQTAMYQLTDDASLDMMIVVGGFNSSNTTQLQQIAEMKGLQSFWVDSAARIDVANNAIAHKMSYGELKETSNWIKAEGPLNIGITSGASTPDRAIEEVLEKIFKIRDPNFTGITPKMVAANLKAPDHDH